MNKLVDSSTAPSAADGDAPGTTTLVAVVIREHNEEST